MNTVEQLAAALIYVARAHHNAVAPSKKHDPQHCDFWLCSCFTCTRARLALDASGISRDDLNGMA